MDEYLSDNIFLPDINNERAEKNATYAENLASLRRLVLFRFENEYTVVPRGRWGFGSHRLCVAHFGQQLRGRDQSAGSRRTCWALTS